MGLSPVSLSFFIFFAAIFAAYWLVRGNAAQKWLLLVASYVFYAFFDYRFCLLLLATSLLGHVLGKGLDGATDARRRKRLLVTGLTANLVILGLFKYFDWFSRGATWLLTHLGFNADAFTLRLVLPVGISFFLFKIMSYLIDVYRGRMPACLGVLDFLVYVAFFPQLLAGPIDRASSFLPQLIRKRTFDYGLAVEGSRQILWGLFKKLALADGLAAIADPIIENHKQAQGPELALGAVLLSFVIYCDYSGYTDISIGLSKLLGIRSMRNFAYPYFSQSVAEFWRRWNISVSSWFRDYVYDPLAWSSPLSRMPFNIMVTFLLSGLWHGASLNFVAWGGMLGIGVAFTAVRRRPVLTAADTPGGERLTASTAFKMLATFAFISLSWVFFFSSSMSEALAILGRILTPPLDPHAWLAAVHRLGHRGIITLALLGAFIVVEWRHRRQECVLDLRVRSRLLRWSVYTAVCWATALVADPMLPGRFIYYRF